MLSFWLNQHARETQKAFEKQNALDAANTMSKQSLSGVIMSTPVDDCEKIILQISIMEVRLKAGTRIITEFGYILIYLFI